jgi:hypothetical protein
MKNQPNREHILLWKINKIDKPLARLTRGHRDSILINKLINEKGDITTESKEIKKSSDTTKKSLYSKQQKNMDEMDNFVHRCQVPKLSQDQINDLNSPISLKEIEIFFFIYLFITYFPQLHFQCYPKSPPYPPPLPYLPIPIFLALAFPCTGAYKVCVSNGPLFPVMADLAIF